MSKKIYLCTNNFYTLFGTVSKKVTQGASKIYTAVKFFIKPSDNGEKETSDKR